MLISFFNRLPVPLVAVGAGVGAGGLAYEADSVATGGSTEKGPGVVSGKID